MRSSVHLRTLWLRLDMRDSKRPFVSDNIQYSDTDLSMQHALTAHTIPETVRVIYNDENLKRGWMAKIYWRRNKKKAVISGVSPFLAALW